MAEKQEDTDRNDHKEIYPYTDHQQVDSLSRY